MQIKFRSIGLIIGLLFAFSMAAFGQFQTGTIEGAVTDPTGKVVAGATVTLTDPKTGNTQTATTTSAGTFRFSSLVPGDYSLMIEGAGFAKASVEKVTVQVGTVARADVQMRVGGAAETVNVDIGDTEVQVDTTRQTVDGVINAQQIVALPLNDRNFLDLAVLQPGVTVVDGGVIDPTKTNTFRAVRVNGGSGTGTRVQIEGIDVTDETVGTTVANFSTDAVQEFNLARSSFDLSTSLTTSGAVSIASRTGGNQFTGSGFWFLQRDTFDARPGFSETKPDFKRDQFGYRFGGPFIKDKLFFFSNAERLDQEDFTAFGSTNFPGFNSESVLPLKTFNTLQRLDYHWTDSVRLFYLFNHSDDLSTGGSLWSPFSNIDWTNTHIVGANISGTNLTHALRFGYVNFNNRIASTEIAGFEFPRAPGGTPVQVNVGDLSFGPNTLAPQQTYQDNYQGKYDGSWIKGSHVIRFGGEVTRIILGGFANFSGPLSLLGDVNMLAPGGNPANPLDYISTSDNVFGSTFNVGPSSGFFTAVPAHGLPFGGKRDTRFSWYVGDTWKARRNLTLNFGVRHNYDTTFFVNPGVRSLTALNVYGAGIGDPPKYPKDAFSPQLGFAWDVFGDGKTSIRGGAYLAYESNIFNNSIFDENGRNAPGIGPIAFDASGVFGPTGDPIVVNGIPGCAPASVAEGDYTCLEGRRLGDILPFVEQINTALQTAYSNIPNYDPNAGLSNFDLDPSQVSGLTFPFPGDYKLPYSMQFNIGFQREIARGHVLSVDYVRMRGVGLPVQIVDREQRRDVNFFNEAAVRASIGTRIGVAPANVNPTTIQAFLANNPSATIATFALMNDTNWPGATPSRLVGRMIIGGFSLYQGLQVSMNGRFSSGIWKGLAFGGHQLFRGMSYTLAYALSRNESTTGGGRPEFLATASRNRDFNLNFGPNALDRTHNLTISASMDLIGGFRLDQIWRVATAPPLTLTVPNPLGGNGYFAVDFNGDGGTGTTPRADLLPGTNVGYFGRRISNIDALNQYITRYNEDVAGHLTPHGQRLVTAGIFSEAQLIALGAVSPRIRLIPAGNPNPFETRWNADMRLSRPIKIVSERFVLEPSFSVFNVFNNNAHGTYTGLVLQTSTPGCGSLSYDYSADPLHCGGSSTADPVSALAALDESRGLVFRRRQLQFGIRFTF